MSQHPSPTALTDDEHALVRRAAFGAIALVSNADPGFFATFKESMAGSKALQDAPEGVRELLAEGGMPAPRTGSPEEVEAGVLNDLRQVMRVLSAKAPRQVTGFRDVLLDATDRVARASDGVAPEEQAVIDRIRTAISTGIAGERPTGDTAADAPRQ